MSLVAGADYRITMPRCEESARAAEAFSAFMALDSFVANRRTKSGENPCDIRPFVLDGGLSETDEGYEITLHTAATSAGMLKPSLWLDCLREYAGCGEIPHMIYRTAILARSASGALSPMEEV